MFNFFLIFLLLPRGCGVLCVYLYKEDYIRVYEVCLLLGNVSIFVFPLIAERKWFLNMSYSSQQGVVVGL